MKKLITIIIAISAFAFSTKAQDLVKIDSVKVTVSHGSEATNLAFDYEVVNYIDMTQAELWSNLRSWIAKSFKPTSVEIDDKDAGRIFVTYDKPGADIAKVIKATAWSSMQVDVKDGRYRIKFLNQRMETRSTSPNTAGMSMAQIQDAISQANEVGEIGGKVFGRSSSWAMAVIADKQVEQPILVKAVDAIHEMNKSIIDSLNEAIRVRDDF